MAKKMAIFLGFLLVINPAWSEECFNFDKLFVPEKSDEEVSDDLKHFHSLLVKFFFIKDGNSRQQIPLSISWDTARKLARFMDREGLDIRVREDLYSKEMESIYGLSVGAAFVAGFILNAYGTPKMKMLFTKIVIPRVAMIGAGILVGVGTIFGGWIGGDYVPIPQGSCDLVLKSSVFKKGVPLSSLTLDSFTADTFGRSQRRK